MTERRSTILVVDNNQTFTMYLALLLRRLDFDILSVPTPEQALDLLDTQSIDAIICEGRTASFDGLEVLHLVRKRYTVDQLPIIVIATQGSQSDRTAFLAGGANTFLTKPITAAQLHQSLHGFIRFENGVRRYPRVRLNHQVRVESPIGTEDLYLTSLSEGGAFIRHDTPLATGTEVTVHFPTPCGIQLPLRGHVLYNRQLFDNPFVVEPGFAILFRPLPVAQKTLLGKFVEHCLAGDLEPFPTSNDFAQNA